MAVTTFLVFWSSNQHLAVVGGRVAHYPAGPAEINDNRQLAFRTFGADDADARLPLRAYWQGTVFNRGIR
jgi:hypothetical protein